MDDGPENPVNLMFMTTKLCWSIRSSKERFAIFNGNIPHKTKALFKANTSSKKGFIALVIKPLHEFICLNIFSGWHRESIEFFFRMRIDRKPINNSS